MSHYLSLDKMVQELAGTDPDELLRQYGTFHKHSAKKPTCSVTGIPESVTIDNNTKKQAFEDAADPEQALKDWDRCSNRDSSTGELPNW